jgi:hypothetical protein
MAFDKKFNLDDYEVVKVRKKKFYETFEDGRIIAELITHSETTALFKVAIYKNAEEQARNLPMSTGYASETKGQKGFANAFAFLENCEESAVGRALDNLGFSGNNKCSREEIIKVQNASEDAEKVENEQKEEIKEETKTLGQSFRKTKSIL